MTLDSKKECIIDARKEFGKEGTGSFELTKMAWREYDTEQNTKKSGSAKLSNEENMLPRQRNKEWNDTEKETEKRSFSKISVAFEEHEA